MLKLQAAEADGPGQNVKRYCPQESGERYGAAVVQLTDEYRADDRRCHNARYHRYVET